MNGLDRIIEEITRDADDEANRIIEDARNAARRVTEKADEKAEAIKTDALGRAELEYKRVLARARSAGEITKKSALLREKQKIINSILKDAHVKIIAMDNDEYFAFLTRLLKKYASRKDGEIIFSERDLKRVTDEFAAAAKEKGLRISDKTRAIDGGFILSYGEVEENCSIEALMDSEKERLHDKVNGFLFG